MESGAANKRVLLTGATGFVGKVVLEELVRRREELGIEEIHLVIRRSLSTDARVRFDKMSRSKAFSMLPLGWQGVCQVVEADLGDPNALPRRTALAQRITHIIHCAASVEFDLPVSQAAHANITSVLNMMAFARKCGGLVKMVSVSTAYVTPHAGADVAVEECLAPLPRAPREMYAEMLAGPKEAGELDARLMSETGHPNSYTLSKCIAEHLLMEERGDVPLTIVRPSIISACNEQPFPGWIDSRAAFAGFVALIGMGHLRAVNVDPKSALDIVPCDEVASRLLHCAFVEGPHDQLQIRHAVAGRRNSPTIKECCDLILNQFKLHPHDKPTALAWVGKGGLRFRAYDWTLHKAPIVAVTALSKMTGKKRQARAAARLGDTITALNTAFPYFTHNTFDFHSSLPLPPSFNRLDYVATACAGIGNHLLGRDPRRATLGGRRDPQKSDLRFALTQPSGNATVRALGMLVKKGLRYCVDEVTFDHPSFEDAIAHVPSDALVVVIPTHRSYMDFMLVPLLCFARPELGIKPPRIAAAEEFSRIPLLGKIFEKAGAFYIKRGQGKADGKLNAAIDLLVENHETLMFFVEGTRSRDRRFMTPKTGLLRALAATGRKFVILPVAISYDRVPEEDALISEIKTGDKPQMRLGPLVSWLGRVARGRVKLGRVHLSCGRPVELGPEHDVPAVAREIMGELQRKTVTSTHHLEAFLQSLPRSAGGNAEGIDLGWLRTAIEARGGEVLDSTLDVEHALDPLAERTLRQQFQHLFYPDALARYADQPDIVAAIEREHFLDTPVAIDGTSASDPRLERLLDALFCDTLHVASERPRSNAGAGSMFAMLRNLVGGVTDRARA